MAKVLIKKLLQLRFLSSYRRRSSCWTNQQLHPLNHAFLDHGAPLERRTTEIAA
jgi:hypothetical protein